MDILPDLPAPGTIPSEDIAIWESLSEPHPSPEQVAHDARTRRVKPRRRKCAACGQGVKLLSGLCQDCWAAYKRARAVIRRLERPSRYAPRIYREHQPACEHTDD